MRLPYVPNPPPASSVQEAAVVARIQERRSPRPLQPLDLTLLHSPAVADGWNSFLGAVRSCAGGAAGTDLGADLKELAISRVAVCNGAWYEWMHHAPLAEKAGVSEKVMAAAREEKDFAPEGKEKAIEKPDGVGEREWAVLRYTDAMTRHVKVADGLFDEVKQVLGENRLVVELTATIACYNCVSRFLVALDVGEKNGTGPDTAVATH